MTLLNIEDGRHEVVVVLVVVVRATVVVDVPTVGGGILRRNNSIPFTITVSVSKCRKQFTLGAPK
ncbi:MAG: hypothetical protein IJU89_00405 [Alphaproteobacteria bacterium]|nr:hypothetical protein [Alphaproteobacteria bacterium]